METGEPPMKNLLALILMILALTSCQKTKEDIPPQNTFEGLMGCALPQWKHVQTKEDFENLAFFKAVYENNISLLDQPAAEKIPKVVHFIWLGPKPFPRESIENVRTWMGHHPDWTFKFWTDRERPLPHPDMVLCPLKDFSFRKLEPHFYSTDNYGERSDLLRYEILYNEGGVYVDHDVKCMKNFDALNNTYDFYCGLEVPYPTALSSSLLPTNNLVGSKPHHLLLDHMMTWLEERWDQIEKDYPGKDRDAVISRVSHRTFLVLGDTFKKYCNQNGNTDIALPTYYFNSPKESQAIYAQHTYKGTWFENKSPFEKSTGKRLMKLSKKTNKLLLAVGILAGLNILGFGALTTLIIKRR